MNKAAIKNFAVEARKKLIASVKDKAGRIGITKENITDAISKGEGYAVFPTLIGIETTLTGKEVKQRENLVHRIKEKGYDSVMEEVAYTWFNRIIAIRFMEVNDYLPSRIRVLSSETKGKFEPDIVTQAPNIDLELTQQEIEKIISLKEKNELDKLFRLLFIKQCNELGKILPELFENTSKDNKDYTEILLDISYTNETGVIRDLLKIDEEDFLEAVEIIGWMYQYYNTEPKDETFALLKQNVKITKERIPAATQLFTPDWIVRYMVENSLGRLWLEGHPNDTLKAGWKYYLDEAEQEPDVVRQLEKIRVEYKNINPEEIKVIDPCMGSGHILVYAFEVLMQIYESRGYSQRDAAKRIVENNLYGLDIDNRAYQLAYFALMMKARQYNRRIFNSETSFHVYAIQESNGINRAQLKFFGHRMNELERNIALNQIDYLLDTMQDAKEYGSIINIDNLNWDFLYRFTDDVDFSGQISFDIVGLGDTQKELYRLVEIAQVMAQKYNVVVTNPPYMGSGGMSSKLSKYVKQNYPNSKSDMFACFIEKGISQASTLGYVSMITMQNWMFLSSFEEIRRVVLSKMISSLVHIGYNSFPEINSKIAQAVAFCILNRLTVGYKGRYLDLNYKYPQAFDKENAFNVERFDFSHSVASEMFKKIPNMPIAYWVSKNFINCYNDNVTLNKVCTIFEGLKSRDKETFLRLWFEVSSNKWKPYAKGGGFRKWYGNNDYVLNWGENGDEVRNFKKSSGANFKYYFKPTITYSALTSYKFSGRYIEYSLFGGGGGGITNTKYLNYILGFVNSNVFFYLINAISPTLNFEVGQVGQQPIIISEKYIEYINSLVTENITISRDDWDSYETSWDFVKHPLIQNKVKISDCFVECEKVSEKRFKKLKRSEEELNRIFIETYGLQNELTPEVKDKEVTVRKADLQRDIRSFISYVVGCMFGRYSLTVDGLTYVRGEWDDSKYTTFIPDKDNIIPITDEEYFDDDIVARFVNFVKVVYGEETLEENLDFIANALGNKGSTSREVIRNYFLKDFYKDHVKTYQKRPIYWLFDSGKENGFKALIYLHRYDEDTVGRVRADYLHKTQAAIENAIANCDVVLESKASASDKAKAVKHKEKLVKQLAETRIYDQAIAHIAHQRIPLDLDDGVSVNYEKFQGIEVSSEGKKSVKVDLLGKI